MTAIARKSVIALAAILPVLSQSTPALAQKGKLSLIRDAEIEGLLRDYTQPLFKAAGLGKGAVDIYIVNDDSFNAFVTGRRMFINTGALKISESPNEIIGVLAHETGHIIGGHQNRLRDRVDRANIMAALAMVAGAGAVLAGGDAGGAAGQALALGSQSAILRDLLSYRRSEEASADNTAIQLLDKTGQSGSGILRTFERFSQDLLFAGSRIDPYLQSHPMPRDRIALLEEIARKSPNFERLDPPALQLRHDMARAK
ncbi:MAG: M48 family metalloprotease, partial [Nitratireductor sp.]|nr:M48 family metalloprotease [Nitratireductor sp.]